MSKETNNYINYLDLDPATQEVVNNILERRDNRRISRADAETIFVGPYSCEHDLESVEYLDGGDDSLPRVVFKYSVKIDMKENSNSLKDDFIHVIQTLTFCNFRRYGWSWTDDPKGEYGYSGGTVWPNRPVELIGSGEMTSEEIIRTSFIMDVARMAEKGGFYAGRVIYSREGKEALKKLLQDALNNHDAHRWAGRAKVSRRFEGTVNREENCTLWRHRL